MNSQLNEVTMPSDSILKLTEVIRIQDRVRRTLTHYCVYEGESQLAVELLIKQLEIAEELISEEIIKLKRGTE